MARLFRLDESQTFARRRVHGIENTIRDPRRCGSPHQQHGMSLVRKDGITLAPSTGTESYPPILKCDPNGNVIRLISQLVGQPGICCLRYRNHVLHPPKKFPSRLCRQSGILNRKCPHSGWGAIRVVRQECCHSRRAGHSAANTELWPARGKRPAVWIIRTAGTELDTIQVFSGPKADSGP